MPEIGQKDEIWNELRWVILVYVCLNVGYTFFFSLVYGQEPSQDWPSLLQDLKDVLEKGRGGRASILVIAVYMALTTLPLVVSSFLGMMVFNRQGGPILFFLAVFLPFAAYFYFIDRSALSQVIDAAGGFHGGLQYAGRLSSEIFNFYLFKYKLPLTIGSIILGCWAAYRVEKQQGTWRG